MKQPEAEPGSASAASLLEVAVAGRQNGFAGVVSVDRGGATEFVSAYGLADRACQIPNTVATRFAIASGTKG